MWDVALYETFGRERVRPSADLAERLAGQTFGRIFDAGCGSGMSTAVLARMWPDARITGADLSPEMLAAARAALPRVRFVGRDCGPAVRRDAGGRLPCCRSRAGGIEREKPFQSPVLRPIL